nr:hypothetical protein Iba_chr08aCG10060 [Ipomoea batatas]
MRTAVIFTLHFFRAQSRLQCFRPSTLPSSQMQPDGDAERSVDLGRLPRDNICLPLVCDWWLFVAAKGHDPQSSGGSDSSALNGSGRNKGCKNLLFYRGELRLLEKRNCSPEGGDASFDAYPGSQQVSVWLASPPFLCVLRAVLKLACLLYLLLTVGMSGECFHPEPVLPRCRSCLWAEGATCIADLTLLHPYLSLGRIDVLFSSSFEVGGGPGGIGEPKRLGLTSGIACEGVSADFPDGLIMTPD